MFLKINHYTRQYLVIIAANLSLLSSGMNHAWTSPMLVKLRNKNETVLIEPMTDDEASWIASIGWLIGIFVNLFTTASMNKIGRKYSLFLSCLPKIAGSLVLLFADRAWLLIVSRMLTGITDSFFMTCLSAYTSEIASKQVRGSLGVIIQLSVSIGVLLMYAIGPYASYATVNFIFFAVCTLPVIIILFLPKTPYFLYSKGNIEEAKRILLVIRDSKETVDEEIHEYSLTKTEINVNKRELLKNKNVLKSLALVFVLSAGMQIVGICAIYVYLQTILESTKTNIKSKTASLVVGLVQFLAALFSTITIEKLGRKPILITSYFGIALGMVGLGTFFKLKQLGCAVSGVMNIVPLACFILLAYCHSGGLTSVFWPLASELFEGPARTLGLNVGVTVSVVLLFVTTKYFVAATVTIGVAETYWMFAVIAVLMILFVSFCVPETKGKTFHEIQEVLNNDAVEQNEKKDVEGQQVCKL